MDRPASISSRQSDSPVLLHYLTSGQKTELTVPDPWEAGESMACDNRAARSAATNGAGRASRTRGRCRASEWIQRCSVSPSVPLLAFLSGDKSHREATQVAWNYEDHKHDNDEIYCTTRSA